MSKNLIVISEAVKIIYAHEVMRLSLLPTFCFHVFSVTFCLLPRRLLKTSSQDVFKTFSRCLQDVLKISTRRLKDFYKRCVQDVSFKTTFCNYVLKTSWRLLRRQNTVTLKASPRHLQNVFSTSAPSRIIAGSK